MRLDQIEFTFGRLSRKRAAVVNALNEPQITELSHRVLTVQSLEELGL